MILIKDIGVIFKLLKIHRFKILKIEELNNLGAVVQFELNKSNIKPEAFDILMAVYKIMSTYGNTNFLIEVCIYWFETIIGFVYIYFSYAST